MYPHSDLLRGLGVGGGGMAGDLPDYYFRVRENGALVFRIETENRQRRIEMDQIATLNIRNGEVKPHGDRTLTPQDLDEIQRWTADRAQLLAEREVDDILRAVDHMNLTTQWVQSRANDDQLDHVTDALLMAMHDLRTVLVRKGRPADEVAGERGLTSPCPNFLRIFRPDAGICE